MNNECVTARRASMAASIILISREEVCRLGKVAGWQSIRVRLLSPALTLFPTLYLLPACYNRRIVLFQSRPRRSRFKHSSSRSRKKKRTLVWKDTRWTAASYRACFCSIQASQSSIHHGPHPLRVPASAVFFPDSVVLVIQLELQQQQRGKQHILREAKVRQ